MDRPQLLQYELSRHLLLILLIERYHRLIKEYRLALHRLVSFYSLSLPHLGGLHHVVNLHLE